MLNLLPPSQTKELQQEKERRLIIVLGSIFIIFLVSFYLVLFLINSYIAQGKKIQDISIEEIKFQQKGSDFDNFNSMVENYNKKLVQLENFYRSSSNFTQILKLISGIEQPNDLSLTKINISNIIEGGGIKVALSGQSPTREDLIAFKNNLEANEDIKNLDFPPQNWISQSEISFYLTFEIKNNEQ